MTDRYNAFIVVLERDIREDDADATLTALRRIKGVLSVEPHTLSVEDHIAEQRILYKVRHNLFEALETALR